MKKPLVYLAGPYSNPDPVENMNHACRLADDILATGRMVPLIPHLTGTWHMVSPKPYEDWLAYDLEVMYRCDAVFRFGGASSGADAEVVEATKRGIPVFTGTIFVGLRSVSAGGPGWIDLNQWASRWVAPFAPNSWTEPR